MCPGSNLDTYYYPTNSKFTGMTMFYGLEKSVIEFTPEGWKLEVLSRGTYATTDAPKVTFLLGKYVWSVEGDTRACNKGEPYKTDLKLTGCKDDEFTCSDGQCISINERCDQLISCANKSDEVNCQLLKLKDGYKQTVAPIKTVSSTNLTIIPVNVNVSMDLLKVVQIVEVDNKIQMQFTIFLEWYEGRANYFNLKDEVTLNALSQDDIDVMWLPYVIYDNTDNKEATQLQADIYQQFSLAQPML